MNKTINNAFDLQLPSLLKVKKKLRNKTFFITGATGFFGKCILETLINLNNKYCLNLKIYALSRNPDQFIMEHPYLAKHSYITFIKGDIRDFSLPAKFHCDYVIHGATEANYKTKGMYSVIVDGTKHLLDEVNKNSMRTKLVFISSGGVYGCQPSALSHISEDFICNPTTPYGQGKLAAEKLCLNSDISTSIARCFAFVGPYLPLNRHFTIGNFILNGLKKEPIIIKSDGKSCRSYMYSFDLVVWLLKILFEGKNGEAYNVGSEEAISIAELGNLVNKCFGSKLELKILGKPVPGASELYVPSTLKAKKELDLSCVVGLEDAIKKTIEWHLNH